MSKPFRKLLWSFGVLTALYLAAVGVASTPWFRHALERKVIARLDDLTGGRIEIAEMHFNPAILRISFHGLTLHGAELPSEPPLFSAQTVIAELNPLLLFRRKLLLRSLEWDQAEVRLSTTPEGSTNYPWPDGSGLDKLIDLSIDRLVLGHTTVYWNDRRLPLDLEAGDVAILVRLDRQRHYSGTLSSRQTMIRTPFWSPPPTTLTSLFELSRAGLNVPSLAWQSAGFSGQGSLSLRNPASPEGNLTVRTQISIPTFRLPELVGGRLELEGQAIYREGKLEARGRMRAGNLILASSVFRPGRVDLAADVRADRQHLEFANLTVSALGGKAQGQAEVSLEGPSPSFTMRSELRGLDMAQVLQSFPQDQPALARLHLAARIDGTANAAWSGRLENFKSQFDLQFHPRAARVPGSLPVSGDARGAAASGSGLSVELREARFQTPGSTLTAQGSLGTPQSSLSVRFATSDFEEWRPLGQFLTEATEPIPLSLESPATFTGTVSGTFARTEIRGRLECGKFDYRGWTWDGLGAQMVAAPNFFAISSGGLRAGSSAMTLSASAKLDRWRLGPKSMVELALKAQRTPLEGLEVALGVRYPASGLATGYLNLEGTPSNHAGTGSISVEQVALAGESFDSLSAELSVARSVWDLANIRLAKGQGSLTGRMRVDPARHYFSGELHGADFSLAEFKHLSAPGQQPAGIPWIRGRLSFDLGGEGTPVNVQLRSTCTVRDIALPDNALGDLEAEADWQAEKISIKGKSQGPGGSLSFSGEARAGADWPVAITGQYANLRLDPWIHAFLNKRFSAQLTAGGAFSLTGALGNPGQLEVHTQAQDFELSFPSLTWKNDLPVDLRYRDGVLTAGRFRIHGPSTDMLVEGSVRFKAPSAVSLDAQGQADATFLGLMDPEVHATGRSEVKLRVSGSPAQPLVNGSLDVHDVSLGYGALPLRLTGLNGEIRLEGERMTARALHGSSGGGAVTLAGFVTLAEAPRYDVQASLDQVRVHYPTDFTSVVNGNLRLVGTPERGQLGGEVSVRQTTVSESFNLLARLLEANTSAGRPLTGVGAPMASKIKLNVQVTSIPPVRLETHEFRLVADLDLRVQGTLANPVEVGTIHVRSGDAVFRGTRYKLNRGEISMLNPFRTQPVLDLEAETRVERYDLTLDISGPIDHPKIAYRSDPPLPTADILSLLALGYSSQQQEMSTAGGRPLPTAGASALLSEALASQKTGRIQRLFGVSRIKIDPSVGAPGYPGGARVTVEQQVTRDFTLTYATNTASSQYRVIQFEWALNESVSLLGVRDQNGIFGVELKFRRRFK